MNISKGNSEPESGHSATSSEASSVSRQHRRRLSRSISLQKKLAFLCVIMLLSLVAIEGLLIMVGVSFPLLYRTDEQCATRLKSHLNVRYYEEGNSIVQTNSAGFRDLDRQKEKPAGIYRIAIVGDSFCEAIQVDRKKTFASRLQQLLAAEGIDNEVLNFGISGFGTAQALEMLQHNVLDYQPDLVILGFFPGNDVSDNSRALNPGQIKPYYDLVNGELQLDTSFRSDPRFLAARSWSTQAKATLINGLRILQLVNKLYSRWKSPARRPANIGIGLEPDLYRPPPTSDWEKAWAVTEALLREFQRRCQANGAQCLVLMISNPIQVHPDLDQRERFRKENRIESLAYPNRRIEKFCEENEIANLSLTSKFAEEAADSDPPIYFHGFSNTVLGTGHWNELGHRRAAESIAEYLRQHQFNGK